MNPRSQSPSPVHPTFRNYGAARTYGDCDPIYPPKECVRCFAPDPQAERGVGELECSCVACGHTWRERLT